MSLRGVSRVRDPTQCPRILRKKNMSIPGDLRSALAIAKRTNEPGHWDEWLSSARWQRWNQLPVFNDERLTDDERLAPLGLSAVELRDLLGFRRATFGDENETIGWKKDFDAFTMLSRSVTSAPPIGSFGMAEVARPLILGAAAELWQRLTELATFADDSERVLWDSLRNSLTTQLAIDDVGVVCGRTMILEVNVAREEGKLVGETSESRFESFLARIAEASTQQALFEEYPVMARVVTRRLRFWVDRRVEFAQRFMNDAMQIAGSFWNQRMPSSANVTFGKGDSHRQGRTVAIVSTDVGKVVYKPRSAALDVAYHHVIDWFNSKNPEYQLSAVDVINKDEYSWSEHVEAEDSTDSQGADRFAWRLGATTALLYLLRATDFHFENILASGERPIPIDLEALLHVDKESAASGDNLVRNVASEFLTDSVLSVGILPNRVIRTRNGVSSMTDISAAGAHGEQTGFIEVPIVKDAASDKIHVTKGLPQIDVRANAPHDNGEVHKIVDRSTEFAAGFSAAYDLVLDHVGEWTRPGGLLSAFEGTSSRLIARPTAVYGKVMADAYHPDFMRDSLDHLLCIGKLLGGYVGRTDRDEVIRAEIADSFDGDIPFFEVRSSDGVVVRGTTGRPVGKRQHAPLDAVRSFFRSTVSEADKLRQLRVVNFSFAAATSSPREHVSVPRTFTPAPITVDATAKLDAAQRIATRLLDSSVTAHPEGMKAERGWVGLTFAADQWWTLSPSGFDLYAGTSGIALALATTGQACNDSRIERAAIDLFEQLAESAIAVSRLQTIPLEPEKREGLDNGVFGTFAGMQYALSHAGVRYGRSDLLDAAESLVAPLEMLASTDTNFDLVSGNAGSIMSLLSLGEARGVSEAFEVAKKAGERLVQSASRHGEAIAWHSKFNRRPLTGMSHGTLGIALALARLREATGDEGERLLDTVRGALGYERTHFSEKTGDWADLRDDSAGAAGTMRAWCHGSPGGILGRSGLLDLGLPRDIERELLEEVRRGAAATLEALADHGGYFGQGNDCLCHGDVGNLVIAESVEHLLESQGDTRSIIDGAWGATFGLAKNTGWTSGIPMKLEIPGLMTGLAGIAWGLAFSAVGSGAEPNLLLVEGPTKLRASRKDLPNDDER